MPGYTYPVYPEVPDGPRPLAHVDAVDLAEQGERDVVSRRPDVLLGDDHCRLAYLFQQDRLPFEVGQAELLAELGTGELCLV